MLNHSALLLLIPLFYIQVIGDSNITEWTKLKKKEKKKMKTHCFINQTILLSLVITVYIHNTIVTIKNIIFKVKPCIRYFSWSKKKIATAFQN